jgi:Na+:H+ antiporter, NhaA family
MNRFGVRHAWLYVAVGVVLWVVVLRSGVHATLAGVVLACAIPLQLTPGRPDADAPSLLHRFERALHLPVNFLILPIFGLANAGVTFVGLSAGAFTAPVTLGVALGLFVGKLVGVVGASLLAIRFGLADMPAHASKTQLIGVGLLCGIGFTMSLFITLLAFPNDAGLQGEAKIGILCGSR